MYDNTRFFLKNKLTYFNITTYLRPEITPLPMNLRSLVSSLLTSALLLSAQAQSATVLYREDFTSGWTNYGSTIIGQKPGWTTNYPASQNALTVQNGAPAHLSYVAGGSTKDLTFQNEQSVNPDLIYTFSALIRNDDLGGSNASQQGTLEIRLQGDGGRTLGAFSLRARNGSSSFISFLPGSGGGSSAGSAPLALQQGLSGGIWYQLTMVYTPKVNTISLSLHDTGTNALVTSASGTISGNAMNATVIRGLHFTSGTLGAGVTSEFLVTNLSITSAVPEPGVAALLLLGLPMAVWGGFLRRK